MMDEAVEHVRRLPHSDLSLVAARYGVRLGALKAACYRVGVKATLAAPTTIRREAADPSALTEEERTVLAMLRAGARQAEIYRAVGRSRHTMIANIARWLAAREPGIRAPGRYGPRAPQAPETEPEIPGKAQSWTLQARLWGERAIVRYPDRVPPEWVPLRSGLLRERECPSSSLPWSVEITLVLYGGEVSLVAGAADHWPRVVSRALLPGTYPLVIAPGAPPYGRLVVSPASPLRRSEPAYRQAYSVSL